MILLPIGDVNDEGHKHASVVNWGLILACIAVSAYQYYLYSLGPGQLRAFMDLWTYDPVKELGPAFLDLSYPARIGKLLVELCNLSKGTFVKMAAAAFLHGGLFHLIPNMIALWMLGDNVEYVMGAFRYLVFFILTAVIATCGQLVFATPANFGGIIGASGGIFGVAAAYLVYFPRARINIFYWVLLFFWGVRPVSARFLIGLYFVSQFATSIFGHGGDFGNVAVWAHIWGFLAGVILCFPFRRGRDDAHKYYQPKPATPPYSKTPWSPPTGGWGKPEDTSGWNSRAKSKFGTEEKPGSGPWGNRPNG